MGKITRSTHSERRWAGNDVPSVAILDDLDGIVDRLEKAEGELGNLQGQERSLLASIADKQTQVNNLTAKAERSRHAFRILRGDLVDTSGELVLDAVPVRE